MFRTDLLANSETFIRDQVGALASWEPVLVGRWEYPGGLPTPGIPRQIVPETSSRMLATLRDALRLPDPRLVGRLKALEVDLVHAHFGVDATDIWPSVKAAGLPMIVTLHGYDINIEPAWWEAGHGGPRRRSYPRRLRALGREPAVRFVAVSRAIQQRAIACGLPEDKVSLAYIGVDTQRFQPGGLPIAQRRPRILFVGRMVEKKAPLLMVRAFAEVRRTVPDAELVMIGEGPLRAAAAATSQELGVPVRFAGSVASEEVLAQLQEARVLCLPSVTAANGDAEGFGLVLLEAQAAGVPVVSSALGGAGEGLLHGVTGYACAEGALDELAGSLAKLLQDDDAAANASAAATRFVRANFDLRQCCTALEVLYDRYSRRAVSA